MTIVIVVIYIQISTFVNCIALKPKLSVHYNTKQAVMQ